MPSALHETLVLLFQDWPRLAATLLSKVLSMPVPKFTEARIESADLTEVEPAEYRADSLVLLRRGGKTAAAVVVEVQLEVKPEKRYVWPAYAAAARKRFRCPACVLVLTPRERVARWAAKPIALGFGSTFHPLVLGPRRVPAVDDLKAARREPGLAVLSVMGHGRAKADLAEAVASAAFRALKGHEHANLYYDLMLMWLGRAAREALMDPERYEFQSEFARRYVAQGRAEGRNEGRVDVVLRQLDTRFGPLPAGAESRVRSATLEELERWADRLLTASSLDEVFAE